MKPWNGLLPLSWLVGAVTEIRNLAFEFGVVRAKSAGVPTISVGNMTAGGSGKTPLVEYIVGRLVDAGISTAVVSRGYGRSSGGVVVVSDGRSVLVDAERGGDEPVQIARRFPGVRVVVGERRYDAAREAVGRLSARVVVMDDGFQHRYLHRDANLLVLDSRTDITAEPLLPAGYRREPLRGIGRADLVLFSRVKEDDGLPDWMRKIERWYAGPRAAFRTEIRSFQRTEGSRSVPVEEVRNIPVFAFSGIGDHGQFLDSLRGAGVRIAGDLGFPDHHVFTADDLQRVTAYAQSAGARGVVTTEKDAARLRGRKGVHEEFLGRADVLVAQAAIRFTMGEEAVNALIDRIAAQARG